MTKTIAATAAMLALVCACGRGYTNGPSSLADAGAQISGGAIIDAGAPQAVADAGHDGGFDGGCVTSSISGLHVMDGCGGGSAVGATISVSGQTCSVSILLPTGSGHCTGVAMGGSNAFTGACGGYTGCASSSLPGAIVCNASSGPCAISLSCDGGCH